VSWQKLKNSVVSAAAGIVNTLNRFLVYLSRPLNLFRFVVILVAIDFIAFMSLTKSSYLNLLNPALFLWSLPGESRTTMDLYFPRSLSLTGIEKIHTEDEVPVPNTKPGAAAVKAAEKPLDESQISTEVVLIKKKVAKVKISSGADGGEAVARRVLLELIAGPSSEVETLKARNLLKEPMFLRAMWNHGGTLYISTEKNVWDKMTPQERKISEYCILESLKKNLPADKFVLLKE
jgi:hypothetical protein